MEIRKITVKTQLLIALALVLAGIALRFVPHLPNFAPVGAVALFAGAVLGWRLAVWLPLLVMMLSDFVLGFYPGIELTWAGFLLVALYGMLFRNARFSNRVTLGALGGSTIFFAVSNFGVWLSSGMYAHTIDGLVQCYTMALPFFRMTFMGDVFYGFVLFGSYALAVQLIAHRASRKQVAML